MFKFCDLRIDFELCYDLTRFIVFVIIFVYMLRIFSIFYFYALHISTLFLILKQQQNSNLQPKKHASPPTPLRVFGLKLKEMVC